MPIIEVNHITKEYQLGQVQSLKTTVFKQWRRLTDQPIVERAPFKSLDDVSFSIKPGEVAGIIGTNWASKSNENWCLAPLICSLICFHHPDAPSQN